MAGQNAGRTRNTTVRDRHRTVIARGKPDCALCLQPIDYSLSVLPDQHGAKCSGNCTGCIPHPMRFEVDHIVPFGPNPSPERIAELDVLSNKQPSHRRCNRDKWDKVAVEDGGPRTYITTRSW